ncbi:hypothetical protein [Candidatus Palauibacter sp.]|uniref:hypothetical protein n=1 Tax=Candidatus Palauibacter sp. TaxID=3101350 RepID=UPI003CC52368
MRYWVFVLALIATGCGEEAITPPDYWPCDLACGSIGFNIAGMVTDEGGEPVSSVLVEGEVAIHDATKCIFDRGSTRDAHSYLDGTYFVSWADPATYTTVGGCVSLRFTPPQDSGLATVSIDSLPVTLYSVDDPARRDTVFVDVVLPKG